MKELSASRHGVSQGSSRCERFKVLLLSSFKHQKNSGVSTTKALMQRSRCDICLVSYFVFISCSSQHPEEAKMSLGWAMMGGWNHQELTCWVHMGWSFSIAISWASCLPPWRYYINKGLQRLFSFGYENYFLGRGFQRPSNRSVGRVSELTFMSHFGRPILPKAQKPRPACMVSSAIISAHDQPLQYISHPAAPYGSFTLLNTFFSEIMPQTN